MGKLDALDEVEAGDTVRRIDDRTEWKVAGFVPYDGHAYSAGHTHSGDVRMLQIVRKQRLIRHLTVQLRREAKAQHDGGLIGFGYSLERVAASVGAAASNAKALSIIDQAADDLGFKDGYLGRGYTLKAIADQARTALSASENKVDPQAETDSEPWAAP